mmetsp:Transcript_12458/g.30216  ORF Transcript_12458/g.30216 Transcript_12458/m.30216 type:complete len:228 (+) Transcript_12458:732-1415(+)
MTALGGGGRAGGHDDVATNVGEGVGAQGIAAGEADGAACAAIQASVNVVAATDRYSASLGASHGGVTCSHAYLPAAASVTGADREIDVTGLAEPCRTSDELNIARETVESLAGRHVCPSAVALGRLAGVHGKLTGTANGGHTSVDQYVTAHAHSTRGGCRHLHVATRSGMAEAARHLHCTAIGVRRSTGSEGYITTVESSALRLAGGHRYCATCAERGGTHAGSDVA